MHITPHPSRSTSTRGLVTMAALLLAILLLLSACSGDDAATDAGTDAPAEPTDAPAEPTDAPAEPTDAPAEPTDAPAEPTEAEPTDAEPTDEATDAPSDAGSAAPTEAAGGGETLEVTAVDYAFEGVPAEITAGTEVTLVGAPDAEPHELVAFRLEEGDERPAMEILSSGGPDGPPPGEFSGVIIAPPGGAPAIAPNGPVVLSEPGRYLFVCFIPTGTTPESFGEVAGSGGTSEDLPQTGPPHFVQGMVADVTVTG